jgi:hypothetical protein
MTQVHFGCRLVSFCHCDDGNGSCWLGGLHASQEHFLDVSWCMWRASQSCWSHLPTPPVLWLLERGAHKRVGGANLDLTFLAYVAFVP